MSEVFKDFMCIHGEEKARADEVLEWAKKDLEADDSNLLSCVVCGLELDFSASIDDMYCDEWALITASTWKKSEDGEPVFRTYIQCDTLEHGIAATWKAFKERFTSDIDETGKSERSGREGGSPKSEDQGTS